ncbi:MAG: hypothetical protein A2788_00315 [Candidatus Abawacabacteria bacterium RIFCSPHIGHO2_01_FULL_46_8]|uniref:Ribosomal RNA large subunit methyltransferase K/L-like methyltransferase domain-containing protein n=1 Tax=Candidatus Abawacabacteria bacterium RIFCSPHIGHO2_01_FULL_46_8 TaxID=1817815 RepID=A0A1F4XNP2_9BACT|nr:MAG: hypothetical protein A2788_00315 [Candidatus Abawacabacteria bacterium RIFCSPHIGHO2_01_FULL_46_8]
MAQSIFIFGRQAKIGLAELTSITGSAALKTIAQGQVALANLTIKDPQAYLNQLGGSVKLLKLIADFKDEKILLNTMFNQLPSQPAKLFFGISYLGPSSIHQRLKQIKQWGMQLKKLLKGRKQGARFVSSRDPLLSSVIVRKNKLLSEAGKELVVMANKPHEFYLGETLAVQDFAAYSARDYGRPARDPKRGSLPPKLAQIMLNLAQVKPGQTIYDPCCGQGTILQEALLKGVTAIGSDLDHVAITASETNLAWLIKQGHLSKPDYQLFKADASKNERKLPPLDAIVTEGSLGPPLRKPPSKAQAEKLLAESITLITSILSTKRPFLKPGGRVIICLPYYQTDQGWLDPAPTFQNKLTSLGFTATTAPLLYQREQQLIGRQIWSLKLTLD